ncbi:MAG TPA: DNA methyltransferase [Dehalococcoidia bacterium]|nr:DNA methyltransferase [Dehalococcoidia bacterium]
MKKSAPNRKTRPVMPMPLPLDSDEVTARDEYGTMLSELETGEATSETEGFVNLNKDRFLLALNEAEACDSVPRFRASILRLKNTLARPLSDHKGLLAAESDTGTVSLRRDILLQELDQMLEAYTLERAIYYLRRLKQGISEARSSAINDLNLLRWKEYDNIITDSLWVWDKRDTSGSHLGWYWGNFIPQIPHQMMLRYTKRNDWVLDTFVGSGTTLIECKRLGRNGIGVELNPEVAQKAVELIEKEKNAYNITTEVVTADSRDVDYACILQKHHVTAVQLVIMHPPYHDIIKFSSDPRDLSNAKDTQQFLSMFGQVVDNVAPYLEDGRYLVVVIGDKYAKGEWIPLGFKCMSEVMSRGYILKSIVVKNFDETRAKRNQKELWRYRALVGGFYVFKHEYVLLFQKKG